MEKEKTWRNEKRKTGGSIKIINGKIYARIQYLDEITGKRKEKLKLAPNRTKAREYIKDMRKDLNQGGQAALESDKLTFKQVAEKYENTKLVAPVVQNGIKVSGKKSFQDQIYKIKSLIAHFGNKAIRSIKPSDLEAYKNERLNTAVVIEKKVKKENPKKERKKFIYEKVKVSRPRTIASVNRELSLLRQIFVFAEAEDYISRNPFHKTKNLISADSEVARERVLSVDEEKLLLLACDHESRQHIKPLIITALDTAMRKGEMLKLKWSDVDFNFSKITVLAENSKTATKRTVGMTSRVKSELTKLWENSPQLLDHRVFGIKADFKRSWHSALKKAGIDDLHFHDLRHTAITRMIRVGAPASEVMKVSGHTSMKTFHRYVNLTNDSVTAVASLLDSFNVSQQTQKPAVTVSKMVN